MSKQIQVKLRCPYCGNTETTRVVNKNVGYCSDCNMDFVVEKYMERIE